MRYYYTSNIADFLKEDENSILGKLAAANEFSLLKTQRDAWVHQIPILKNNLAGLDGQICLEYTIPRMGRRIDAILLLGGIVFVIEFKIGESEARRADLDQVWDYTLDLKNFHEPSHNRCLVPILLLSDLEVKKNSFDFSLSLENISDPIFCAPEQLRLVLDKCKSLFESSSLNTESWLQGRYSPTPTIIEAAQALYRGHNVAEISRSDSSNNSLSKTSDAISNIINNSRENKRKSICFLTGVPGAGKTLVGLNIATQHTESIGDTYSVFLSGNGPLVAILREALTRDKVATEKARGNPVKKSSVMSEVKAFIQNVHHFRDDCLQEMTAPPREHVALFDEAQRAWDLKQTSIFMKQKKGVLNFEQSEPVFLISCLDRHPDWAVVVCLVGGGQEINTGEAGISEWIEAVLDKFQHWDIHISPKMQDSEYRAIENIAKLHGLDRVFWNDDLHLSVSMRSFRAEKVSHLVKALLDQETAAASTLLQEISHKYPIVLTRDLPKAKAWLKAQARGSERYGMLVSSQAYRLKPHGIDVRPQIDPVHWFLNGKEDVRSSYYLEDVATEFQAQGLELDWACVTWDADFRHTENGWEHWSFRGERWGRIHKAERQNYLKNAYRVLLTRARQGMVIVVPEGNADDPTRKSEYYDSTFEYLCGIGLPTL
ncbi:MAG: DNA/RNA helicase domain-containing protein [Turneriella sp.]